MAKLAKILIPVLFILIVLSGAQFIFDKNKIFNGVKNVILWPIRISRNVIFYNSLEKENMGLRLENEQLNSKILFLEQQDGISLRERKYNYSTAKIFSTYPFNNHQFITIDIGSNQGVKNLMPVLAKENILLGQITAVFQNYSVVRTLTDSNWELPVGIGGSGIRGLFIGERTPLIILIDKNKILEKKTLVYSNGAQFPYGLVIGEIDNLSPNKNNLYQQAEVKFPYDLDNMEEILVLNNF